MKFKFEVNPEFARYCDDYQKNNYGGYCSSCIIAKAVQEVVNCPVEVGLSSVHFYPNKPGSKEYNTRLDKDAIAIRQKFDYKEFDEIKGFITVDIPKAVLKEGVHAQ